MTTTLETAQAGTTLASARASRATTLINGVWSDPEETRDVISPIDGTVTGTIGYGTAADAVRAADAASSAFPEWSAQPARFRSGLLLALSEKLVAAAADIGVVLSRETGKRLPEAVGEIRFAAEYFRWFAEEIRRPHGEIIPAEAANRRHTVERRAAGVAALLTPWNFPVSIQARKLAAALAAGCTTVSRASEKAPLAVVEMFRLLHDCGFPAGAANLVHGPAHQITSALLSHDAVRVVSFTGSTSVGKEIMRLSAERIVRPALELGGDAPFIVFDDADADLAVAGALLAKFRNNGQSCIAANRIFVQRGIYDNFTNRLAAAVNAFTIGDPLADATPDLGPLIDHDRVQAINAYVEEAAAAGARRLTRRFDLPSHGSFAEPVLFDHVPQHATLATSEIFGPVAGIFVFETEAEVVRAANQTEMGLAAYLYSSDLARTTRVAGQLQAGIIGINEALPSAAFAPMGGVKQSGIGREGGSLGLDEFQTVHYVATTL